MPWTRLAALLPGLLLPGCFHTGAFPRSGEVLPAGEIAGGVAVTVAGYAPGTFGTEKGNSAQRSPPSALTILSLGLHLLQGFLRVGVGGRAEVTAVVGAQEMGLGTRYGLVKESAEHGTSLAATALGYFRPTRGGNTSLFSPQHGFGLRSGFDLGHRLGDGTRLLASPTVSFGPEAHAIIATPESKCRGFGGPGCGEYGPGSYAYVLRRELRLHLPLGVSFVVSRPSLNYPETVEGRITLGLVPYLITFAQVLDEKCSRCDASQHTPFHERWGSHLVFGYEAR